MRRFEDIYLKVVGGELSNDEIQAYIDYIKSKDNHRKLESLEIVVDGDYVDLKWKFEPMKFERLRRITGYLTSDLRFWNSAKQSEEKDRVKHV